MSIVLSLDLGTSKLSAMAWDVKTDAPLAICSTVNDTEIPARPAGWHEQNPLQTRDHCFDLIRRLLADPAVAPDHIKGIGFSGQMHGVLLAHIDDRGAPIPLSPLITWRDQRTIDSGRPGGIAVAMERLGPDVSTRTGCGLHPGYGGATLFHLAQNQGIPGDAVALSMADFLVASLTGVFATEPTHAASWGIFDLNTNGWDNESVEALELPDGLLPPARPSGAEAGQILPEVARSLGLPKNIRVAAPVGDNQAGVIGAIGFDTDTTVVNLGSGGQISLPTSQYRFVEGFETRPMPFGGFILVGASLCGGLSYACLRQFFQAAGREIAGEEWDEAAVYARMNAMIARAPDATPELVVDTRLAGVRGAPLIRGSISDIDMHNFTPANLTRAFVKGMFVELLEMAQTAGVTQFERVVATGNGVRKNPAALSIAEQVFKIPCRITTTPEEAALGAARAAARGLGLTE